MASYSWADLGGGIFANPTLSNQARMLAHKQMRFLDIVTPATDFHLGKNSGDTIGFKIHGRLSSTYETALNEYQKIPMVKAPEYTATATVYRRGVASQWTKTRADLDRLDTESQIVETLQENAGRTHDKIIYDAVVAGRSWTYVATGAATNNIGTGAPGAAAAVAFSAWHARRIYNQLFKNNVPFFDGSNYVGIVSPTMHLNLFDDTGANGFVDVKKYANGGADGVMAGEVGSYMNIRYVVENCTLPDTIGTGSAFGSGIFAGLDAAKEIIVNPIELYQNRNLGGDFMQQAAVAWISTLAYKTVFIHATHGQGSVLHYTSS